MVAVANVRPLFRDRKRRVWELDLMRGVAVLAMCFDHLMYDLWCCRYWFDEVVANRVMEMLEEFAMAYWLSWRERGFRFWAHELFVFLFLFLVGTSCAFSRDNARRGALLAVVAAGFTGASFILKAIGIMDDGIVFGILHCIALSILCTAALDNITVRNKKLNLYAPLVLGCAILIFGVFGKYWEWGRPYDNVFVESNFAGYVLGTKGFGDDWFGLFPALGAVLVGMYWGKAVYAARASLFPRFGGRWTAPFTFVGRHALPMYFVHQIVIAGIIILVCLCLGYRMGV